jgi:hypothetical protein
VIDPSDNVSIWMAHVYAAKDVMGQKRMAVGKVFGKQRAHLALGQLSASVETDASSAPDVRPSLRLRTMVRNDGDQRSGAFRVVFYLAQTMIIERLDQRIIEIVLPSLDPGERVPVDITSMVSADRIQSTSYFIIARAEQIEDTEEYSLENNISSTRLRRVEGARSGKWRRCAPFNLPLTLLARADEVIE